MMKCSICDQDKSALSARCFAPDGSYSFGPWYCDECSESEKTTEPWMRGYHAGKTDDHRKLERRRVLFGLKMLLVGVAVGIVISAAVAYMAS